MAFLFPCHVPQPPLNWAEHLWLSEISPTKEAFITTVFEHRNSAWKDHDLLRRLPESVASIKYDEYPPKPSINASRTQHVAEDSVEALLQEIQEAEAGDQNPPEQDEDEGEEGEDNEMDHVVEVEEDDDAVLELAIPELDD